MAVVLLPPVSTFIMGYDFWISSPSIAVKAFFKQFNLCTLSTSTLEIAHESRLRVYLIRPPFFCFSIIKKQYVFGESAEFLIFATNCFFSTL